MPIPQAKLDELKQKHGAVWTVTRDDVDVAFRKPTGAEYRKYISTVAGDKSATFDAFEALCHACVVYPEGPAARDLLDEWPGLVPDIGGEIALVAGKSAKAEAKKA